MALLNFSFPPIAKTYQFSVNNIIAVDTSAALSIASTFVALKNAWTGFSQNPWAVRGSSNSVAAAMDGVDRLTSKTNIVSSSGGVHSWIVLRNASGLEACFDFHHASNNLITLAISQTSSFTGGSTSARPTATNEAVTKTNEEWLAGSGSNARYRLHVAHSTDGKNTFSFVMYQGRIMTFWIAGDVTDAVTNWASPSVFGIGFASSLSSTSTGDWNNYGQFDVIGAQGPSGKMMVRATVLGGAQSSGQVVNSSLNPQPNTAQLSEDALTGKFPLYEMGLNHAVTTGQRGRHGKLVDIWLQTAGLPSGAVLNSSDGLHSLFVAGNFVTPWPVGVFPYVI